MTDILEHVVAPALRPVSSIRVNVGEPIDLGDGVDGRRRIVPILGGEATGELSGRVLGGGADFQVLRPDRVTELEARYPLVLDDGTIVEVINRGIRAGAADDIDRLMRGEVVDPDRIYFRCAPALRAPQGAWEWVNRTLFVGTGRRHPDSVEIAVFAVE